MTGVLLWCFLVLVLMVVGAGVLEVRDFGVLAIVVLAVMELVWELRLEPEVFEIIGVKLEELGPEFLVVTGVELEELETVVFEVTGVGLELNELDPEVFGVPVVE